MNLSVVFLCLVVIGIALAEGLEANAFCVEEVKGCRCRLKNDAVINLEPDGKSDGTPRFTLKNGKNLFEYNPCYPFNRTGEALPGRKQCVKVSACATINDTSPSKQEAVGYPENATFWQNHENIISVNYSVPGDPLIRTTVNLICSHTAKNSEIKTTTNFNKNTAYFVIDLISKCACADGCKEEKKKDGGGLSAGSIFDIIFFVTILVYLCGGITWKKLNGAQGKEILPNVEFWYDFFTLVTEGVMFTFSCCKVKQNYNRL